MINKGYQPKEGEILMCDFNGMITPEMIKKRRVIIIHKHRKNKKLVTVVPLSTTEPLPPESYNIKVDKEYALEHFEKEDVWIKCDMFYMLSIDRLSLQKHSSKGRYIPTVDATLLQNIKDEIFRMLR